MANQGFTRDTGAVKYNAFSTQGVQDNTLAQTIGAVGQFGKDVTEGYALRQAEVGQQEVVDMLKGQEEQPSFIQQQGVVVTPAQEGALPKLQDEEGRILAEGAQATLAPIQRQMDKVKAGVAQGRISERQARVLMDTALTQAINDFPMFEREIRQQSATRFGGDWYGETQRVVFEMAREQEAAALKAAASKTGLAEWQYKQEVEQMMKNNIPMPLIQSNFEVARQLNNEQVQIAANLQALDSRKKGLTNQQEISTLVQLPKLRATLAGIAVGAEAQLATMLSGMGLMKEGVSLQQALASADPKVRADIASAFKQKQLEYRAYIAMNPEFNAMGREALNTELELFDKMTESFIQGLDKPAAFEQYKLQVQAVKDKASLDVLGIRGMPEISAFNDLASNLINAGVYEKESMRQMFMPVLNDFSNLTSAQRANINAVAGGEAPPLGQYDKATKSVGLRMASLAIDPKTNLNPADRIMGVNLVNQSLRNLVNAKDIQEFRDVLDVLAQPGAAEVLPGVLQQVDQDALAKAANTYVTRISMELNKFLDEKGAVLAINPSTGLLEIFQSGANGEPITPMNWAIAGDKNLSSRYLKDLNKVVAVYSHMDGKTDKEHFAKISQKLISVTRGGEGFESYSSEGLSKKEMGTLGNKAFSAAISDTAAKYGIDAKLFDKIIKRESSYNPNARGSSGEIGLGQIMPEVAEQYGYSEADLLDPSKNLDASARLQQELRRNFQGQYTGKDLDAIVVAGYNMGETRLRKAIAGEIPFPQTTIDYVSDVVGVDIRRVAGGETPLAGVGK